MRNPGLKKRLLERLDIIGLLAFSITLLFIAFPHLLFSANVESIPKAVVYYRYFFAAAFIILLILASVSLLLPRRIALVAAAVLGAYALLVLIFDLTYPLQIGLIEEGTETEPAAPVAGAIQIVLMVAAFFALCYIPRKVRGVLAWSLAAVFLIFGLPFLFAPSYTGHVPDYSSISENESAPDFNIYHIVCDAYYGPWLQWSLSELSRDTSELAGFTHYRRNVSNYFGSRSSFPSFMSGTMYSPDNTVMEWYESADKDSIITDLHERGFSTTFYGLSLKHGIRQVQEAYTDDPGGAQVVDLRLAADYWLLRVAPVALRHLILDGHGGGPITRYTTGSVEDPSGDIRTLVSYRQFQKFLADERLRPASGQYVHAYFYPPHPPFQLDRHGNYVGESSYSEQLHLATNMILEIVETLRDLGRFENSLIIVQSDHGSVHGADRRCAGDPLRDFIQMDEVTSEAIREVDPRCLPGTEVEARYLALLLIKPPGDGQDTADLVVNDALVQLLDLRKHIDKLIDEGDCAYPEREQVDIHHGLHIHIRDGKQLWVGHHIMSGYINHYIIRPHGQWEIADTIRFEWE
jgi:hypothetical protein